LINRYFFLGMAAGLGAAFSVLCIGAAILLFPVFSGVEKNIGKHLVKPNFPFSVSHDTNPDGNLDWKCQTLDGQDFDMARLNGKTVFLNFWATWCPPVWRKCPDWIIFAKP